MNITWILLLAFVDVALLCEKVHSSTGNAKCSTSETCPTQCEGCYADGICCACSPGRYGDTCSQYCHGNCYTCSNSGECDTCNSSTVYGPLCDQSCDLCNGRTCTRTRCTQGCQDGYFEAPLHEAKIHELTKYYKCVNCLDTCTSCSSKSNCTRCIDKRWGLTCDLRCPSKCDKCHKETGDCIDEECSRHQYRDHGGQCKSCPKHCQSCVSQSQCTECIGERHGELCDEVDCNSIPHCAECVCLSEQCGIDEIICESCANGYTGNTCENKDNVDDDIIGSTRSDKFTSEESLDNNDKIWQFQGKSKPHTASRVFSWGAVSFTIFVCLLVPFSMFVYRAVLPLMLIRVEHYWRAWV